MISRKTDKIAAVDRFEAAVIQLIQLSEVPESERKEVLIGYFTAKQNLMKEMGLST